MSPDQKMFNIHLSSVLFKRGEDKGKWGIAEQCPWPNVIIWISATPKQNCPDRYYLMFNLSGYPEAAPTAFPWDNEKKERLADGQWPKGNDYVSKVFRPDWKPNGVSALYAPCDRISMAGHDNWRNEHPQLWWKSDFTIVVYLEFVHGLLNSEDYARS